MGPLSTMINRLDQHAMRPIRSWPDKPSRTEHCRLLPGVVVHAGSRIHNPADRRLTEKEQSPLMSSQSDHYTRKPSVPVSMASCQTGLSWTPGYSAWDQSRYDVYLSLCRDPAPTGSVRLRTSIGMSTALVSRSENNVLSFAQINAPGRQ